MAGYNLCVNQLHRLATIHAPSDSWQHLPRDRRNGENSKRGFFWDGPYNTEDEAQDAAQELAEAGSYAVHRCKRCFHVPQGMTTRQKQARERVARGIGCWGWANNQADRGCLVPGPADPPPNRKGERRDLSH